MFDELGEKAAGKFESGAVADLFAANDEALRLAGAESFDEFAARVARVTQKIIDQSNGTTLIVGHAGIYRMAQVLQRGLAPSDMMRVEGVPNGELKHYPY